MKTQLLNVKLMDIARKEIGVHELPGDASHARIIEYLKTVNLDYLPDETPWCSAFIQWCCQELDDLRVIGSQNAAAKSWLNEGLRIEIFEAIPGDVVILNTDGPLSWRGHVGFFAKRTNSRVFLLGGNQGDAVNITSYPIQLVGGVRRLSEE